MPTIHAVRAPLALALGLALSSTALAETSVLDAPATDLPSVVVSASKREQSLASVDGSVYVVERSQLQAAQVHDTLDLARLLPGVQASSSGSLLFPIFSVRGITSAQDFYNPALTVYVDGIPQLPVFASQALLGAERVELLKGPQGTLYGKSAQGGIINVISAPADDTAHLRLRAGVSSRGGELLQVDANAPLKADLLQADIALLHNDAPGDLHNPVTGQDHQGGTKTDAGKLRLRLAPGGAAWSADATFARDCSTSSQDAYVPFDEPGARDIFLSPGTPAEYAGFHQRRCGNSSSLGVRMDIGQWQLSATGGWQTIDIERSFASGPYFSVQPEQWRQNTQELRLASQGADRAWDGVFGLYRQDSTQARDYRNFLPMYGVDAVQSHSDNHSVGQAAYADVTWHMTPRWDLSGGLRASRDRARTQFNGYALDFSALQPLPFAGSARTEGDHVLGRVALGFQASDAWRLYARVSQGYKPGGFNLAPTSLADAEAYGRERSTSLELGARVQAGTVSGSVAVYQIDLRDAQLYSTNEVGYGHLANVGDTRSRGLDADVQWQFVPQWRLSATVQFNDATFRRYADPIGCGDCQGNDVPFAPSFSGDLALEGALDSGIGQWRPRLAVRHMGSHYFDTANLLHQSAYSVVDASLAWQPRAGWEVAVYAHNLGDRHYRTYAFNGGPLGYYAQPALGRTVGMTVGVEF